jgi:hypothetical protein
MTRKNTELVTSVTQLWRSLKVLLILSFGLFIVSCSKYESNKGLTFKSAKKRLVDDWMLYEVSHLSEVEGIVFSDFSSPDTTINSASVDLEITYELVEVLNGQDELITFVETSGTSYDGLLRVRIMETLQDYEIAQWSFSDDKKNIDVIVRYSDGSIYVEKNWEITKLDKNHLWFKDVNSEFKYTRHVLEFDDLGS